MGDSRTPGFKKKPLSADDVPPILTWKPPAATKSSPLRKYYYEMYDPPFFFNNMAAPFDNAPEAKPGQTKTVDNNRPKQANASPIGIPKTMINDARKPMPHCKACTDFKTWMELTANPRRNMPRTEREEKQCPLDSELLGSNTWSFLHTMAAYYPEKPTYEQQHNMKSFIALLSQFYPCHICASHLRDDLKVNPPDTGNNRRLSTWFCEMHNRVNERLGKPIFDCSKVLERWRDGWADNSCD